MFSSLGLSKWSLPSRFLESRAIAHLLVHLCCNWGAGGMQEQDAFFCAPFQGQREKELPKKISAVKKIYLGVCQKVGICQRYFPAQRV